MQNSIRLFLAVSALALGSAVAATQVITAQGPTQSGTFDLRGSQARSEWDYPDTVVIDGAVKIIGFTEIFNDRQVMMNGPRRYWSFLENNSGPIGYASLTDTAWSDTVIYRPDLLLADTLKYHPDPHPAFADQLSPANLTGTHVGFQAGTRNYGGLGYPNGFTLDAARKRIVYFRYMRAGATRYGRLAIRNMTVWTDTGASVTDGPRVELQRTTFAYALSDSASVTFGPSGIRLTSPSASRPLRTGLVWSPKEGLLLRDSRGELYTLRGVRMTKPVSGISSKR